MKRFQFLLLDAGPIIKLFELGLWEEFIHKCDVTVTRTVAEDEVVFAAEGYEQEFIDFGLKSYEEKGLVKVVDLELSVVNDFYNRFNAGYKQIIHPGEKETLALLCNSDENWAVCAADGAVFQVLGLLGKGDHGVSLEEVLCSIGLSRNLEWRFTKRFREKNTAKGKIDAIQDRGLSGH
jgi:hypothetical protein